MDDLRRLLSLAALAVGSLGPSLLAADFYISPTGSDAAQGTKVQPWASFTKAQAAVQESRRLSPLEPVTVWLAGGTYRLTDTIALTARDSGTAQAPVTYRAMPGQRPVLTNARYLSIKDFQPVTDRSTLARIDSASKGKIVALDLAACGVNASPPAAVFSDAGPFPGLYADGHRLTMSRFPKSGFLTMKSVLTNGDKGKQPGTFAYRDNDGPKFEQWQQALEHGLFLKGYWRVMWQSEAIRAQSIDTTAHTVTFAAGISGGIGSKYHRPSGDGKEQYWAFNLLEEVNQPGDWCIDYADRKIYLYPPEGLGEAPIYLSDSTRPIMTITNASHIVVRGLTCEYGLGDGIQIIGGSDNLITGCTIRLRDHYAVRIQGGRRHRVRSCDLYHLGEGGVWLSGGDEASTPRTPAEHQVINNHIHHFSEIVNIYTPAVNCGYVGGSGHIACVGNLVAHNLVHDTPHGGILFGSWDNTFEFNEVFRYCLTSNDLGAFYSFCRYDFMGNNTFRYNFWHSSGQGDGLYFDWDHRDMHIYGNISYLQSREKRGIAFLFKEGTQLDPKFASDPANSQPLDCHDNIAISSETGFNFVVPSASPSTIFNNVTVHCRNPWSYRVISKGKATKASDDNIKATNRSYVEDPGFVDMEHLNFGLKPDAKIRRDLPTFHPIPVDQIGLYVDEDRTTLPSNDEIDRFSKRTSIGGAGYGIEDRKP